MATAVRNLVTQYLEAVAAGDFDRLAPMIHPDATFGGTVKVETRGRDAYLEGFRRLAPILDRIEVRQIVVEGENAAVVYDFITDTGAGSVLSAEFLTLDDGMIVSSVLLFDQRRWPLVLEEIGRRAAQAATLGA